MKFNKKSKKKMNKFIIIILMLSFTACSTISDKAGSLLPKDCPAQGERTIKDILCSEPK